MTEKTLKNLCQELRQMVLEQSYRAGVGHIGSALSIIELLVAIHTHYVRMPTSPKPSLDDDCFILSKGHAALALFALLATQGRIKAEDLERYCQDGSLLGVHPEPGVPGVEFATGSLGYGLSYACGLALAARRLGSARRIAVLISDAECNEGSLWESVLFAAQHQLNNILVVLDNNQQQAFGKTKEVLCLSPLAEKWQAFGWDVQITDGHDLEALQLAIQERQSKAPSLILAETIFGKGVSFMEGQIPWHYLPLSKQEYDSALSEIYR